MEQELQNKKHHPEGNYVDVDTLEMNKGVGRVKQSCVELYEMVKPFLRARTDKLSIMIDGGAHKGDMFAICQERFDKILCFEPVRANYDVLTSRFKEVSYKDKLLTYKYAVGNENKVVKMMLNNPSNPQAWQIDDERVHEENIRRRNEVEEDVRIIRLDEIPLLMLPAVTVDYIKLDVEGYELYALKGAEEIIKHHKPVISAENKSLTRTYGHDPNDVKEYMLSLGYKCVARYASSRDDIFAPISTHI